jgi:hypothetical protein
MNSDELGKAERQGFVSEPYVLSERLTDQYENGGIFGFRF